MAYLNALQSAAAPVGTPPATPAPNVGTPPAAQPHVEAPPYDAANDPAWKGLLDPNDHAFRNFLNELSPEHRQMLLQKAMTMKAQRAAPSPIPGPQLPPNAPMPPP